jgi:hypothetical protein
VGLAVNAIPYKTGFGRRRGNLFIRWNEASCLALPKTSKQAALRRQLLRPSFFNDILVEHDYPIHHLMIESQCDGNYRRSRHHQLSFPWVTAVTVIIADEAVQQSNILHDQAEIA